MSEEPTPSASRDHRVDAIIAAYLEAVDAGRAPDRQELLARHPDLAPDLEVFFADHDRVDQLAQPLRLPSPPPSPGAPPDDGATGAYGAAQPETLASGETPLVGPPLGTKVRYVGDYELLEELGRGGMGVVYKARQTKLRRLVALKMILAGEYAGPQELARFRSEGEAVARLQHPNIVQIFEVGEHGGHPYFSLEFVDGGSLAQKLDGTPLPPKEAAKLVELLARAMHYAYEQGIVHRDLKPANVLLAQDGTPKITDFGLAKKVEGGSGLTQSGAIMGTPSYMAPEQAGGTSKDVGPAADVYALGAILYELLTGRPPFKAATPLDTVLQVVSHEPVPPRQLNPQAPRDLETVCLKCLQKEPRKRYASAAALAEDLWRFLEGEPVAARQASWYEALDHWVRRRPLRASLRAVALLFAAVLTLLPLVQWDKGGVACALVGWVVLVGVLRGASRPLWRGTLAAAPLGLAGAYLGYRLGIPHSLETAGPVADNFLRAWPVLRLMGGPLAGAVLPLVVGIAWAALGRESWRGLLPGAAVFAAGVALGYASPLALSCGVLFAWILGMIVRVVHARWGGDRADILCATLPGMFVGQFLGGMVMLCMLGVGFALAPPDVEVQTSVTLIGVGYIAAFVCVLAGAVFGAIVAALSTRKAGRPSGHLPPRNPL